MNYILYSKYKSLRDLRVSKLGGVVAYSTIICIFWLYVLKPLLRELGTASSCLKFSVLNKSRACKLLINLELAPASSKIRVADYVVVSADYVVVCAT